MKKVLIIDDSTFMRRYLKNILVNNGYEVVGEAANGRTGVKKYKELNPDIVTMDITMEEMNGIDALKHIIEYDAAATVVMVSSMGQDAIVRDAIVAGAKNFVVKPFNEQIVLDTLSKL